MTIDQVINFTIALFIGALIGTERTLRRKDQTTHFAGLRTFILFAEAGAISAWLSADTNPPYIFIIGLICLTAILVVSYWVQNREAKDFPGLTTEISAIITFLLGGVTVLGHAELAVALAIITTGLLALKGTLHRAISKISPTDLMGTLQLLFVTFIILPLLPNEPIDPWGVLVPYKLWLLVILISGLSFVGYVAMRLMGPSKGLLITALFGSLASSTAVTLNLARQSLVSARFQGVATLGILVAWAVMFARIIIEVAIVNSKLLTTLTIPLVSMGVASLAGGGFFYWLSRRHSSPEYHGDTEVVLKNPFRLVPAFQFAVFFAFTLIAGKLVQDYFPESGIYLMSLVAGMADVDAITLSLAELSHEHKVPTKLATQGIILAAMSNTLVKAGIVGYFGTRPLAKSIALTAVVISLIGLVFVFI